MRHRPRSHGSLAAALAGVHGTAGPLAVSAWTEMAPRRPRRRGGLAGPEERPAAPVREPAGKHRRSEELARLEAALFLAREPLTPRRLAKLARLDDGTRARSLIKELRLLQDAAGSAFRVEQIAGGFQMLTRAPFGPWVRRLQDVGPGARLSPAALETLAIVAYRQPTTRAEIEAIRGVGSEEMLRQLLERDFVAIGGRAEDLGRPNVYVTTRRFLAAFGLARLEDLPALAELPGALPRPDDDGPADAAD
jgi:segregation and condensation protein B